MTGAQLAQLAFAILGVSLLGVIACAYVSDRRLPADAQRPVPALTLVGVFLAVSVVGSALSALAIYFTP